MKKGDGYYQFDRDVKVLPVPVKILVPIACDGTGTSYTAHQICLGMSRCGLSTKMFVSRARTDLSQVSHSTAMPGLLKYLPYAWIKSYAQASIEERFLGDIKPGDLALLWPSSSLSLHQKLADRGIPILQESVNSRMKWAKSVLDQVYTDEGLTPNHGITDARVLEEEEKFKLLSGYFAASIGVERAMEGSPLKDHQIFHTSHGVDLSRVKKANEPRKSHCGPLRYVSVGFSSFRKGTHILLKAWERAGIEGKLTLIGGIEAALREHCADLLERDDVEVRPFTRNIDDVYAQSDVFILNSFEEGDPKVTYEAAAHGLALIVSEFGGGRLCSDHDCAQLVAPGDAEGLAKALVAYDQHRDMLVDAAERAKKAVRQYDWALIAAKRAEQLKTCFSDSSDLQAISH